MHWLDIPPDQPFSNDELKNKRLLKALENPDELMHMFGIVATEGVALTEDSGDEPGQP